MLHGFVFTDFVEIIMLREKLLTSGLHSCRVLLPHCAPSERRLRRIHLDTVDPRTTPRIQVEGVEERFQFGSGWAWGVAMADGATAAVKCRRHAAGSRAGGREGRPRSAGAWTAWPCLRVTSHKRAARQRCPGLRVR